MPTLFGFQLSHTLVFNLLFDALVKTTLLLLLAGMCALALKRASANARHFVWRMAFGGVAALFAATCLLPLLARTRGQAPAPLVTVAVWRAPGTLRRIAPEQALARMTDDAPIPLKSQIAAAALSGANAPMATVPTAASGERRLLLGIAVMWIGGAMIALARALTRVRDCAVLERHSHAITDGRILAIAHHAARTIGLPALPALLAQNDGADLFSPLTWGWRRAYILLPCDALTWPDARLDAVLRHELAHVRRGDWMAQRCADVMCALLWFHPLAWLAARQLKATAEQACDDLAVADGVRPALYAQHLIDIARQLQRAPDCAALPFLTRKTLETRLRVILDPCADRRPLPRAAQRTVAGLVVACIAPTALIVPTVSRTLAAEVNAPVRARNNKVTLAGGVTVELLGIARIPPNGHLKPSTSWWQMDGTPLASPPYQSSNVVSGFYADKASYAIGLRISGLADRKERTVQDTKPIVTAVGIKPHTTTDETEWSLITHEQNRYAKVHTIRMEARAAVTQGNLRYGIASGEWTNAESDKIETGTDCMLHRDRHNFPTWTWVPSTQKPRGTLRVAQIKTTDSLGPVTRRIMAYARSGKTAIFNGYWVDRPHGKIEFRVDVPDNIKWSDYRKFQLQTRPYQWAEFRDVQMQPNRQQ